MIQARIDRGLYWDQAWSLVEGCTPVDESCDNCWSAAATNMRAAQKNPKMASRYKGLVQSHHQGRVGLYFNGKVRFMLRDLTKPVRRRVPTTYSIWNDLFHSSVTNEQICLALDVMLAHPRHTYLILTKRVPRMLDFFKNVVPRTAKALNANYQHVWFGTTTPNRRLLERRLPYLIKMARDWDANTFLSAEPLLDDLGLHKVIRDGSEFSPHLPRVIIAGGESGPKARPCSVDWLRCVRDDCAHLGIQFFFKQWGEWLSETQEGCPFVDPAEEYVKERRGLRTANFLSFPNGEITVRVGKKAAGRRLDGELHNGLPW